MKRAAYLPLRRTTSCLIKYQDTLLTILTLYRQAVFVREMEMLSKLNDEVSEYGSTIAILSRDLQAVQCQLPSVQSAELPQPRQIATKLISLQATRQQQQRDQPCVQ